MKREYAQLLAVVLVVGCAKSTEPLPNKNTNWLRDCVDDASCAGGLACICGVCTARCEAANQCGAAGDNVACESLERAQQCSGARGTKSGSICIATCKHSSECGTYGHDFTCQAGMCARASTARLDAGTGVASQRADAGVASRDAAAESDGSAQSLPLDAGADSGVVTPTTCGNGVIDVGEDCDGTVGPFAKCDRCKIVCDSGHANCNADSTDGCERVVTGGADLPAGPGSIPAGCVELLAKDQATPTSVAIDSTNLYWSNQGTRDSLGNIHKDGSIVAMPLGGGPLVMLATDQFFPASLTVDSDHAYWINGPSSKGTGAAVMRVPLAGGKPEVLAGDMAYTNGLVVDDTYAYFFTAVMDGTSNTGLSNMPLYRVPKNGSGSPEELVSSGVINFSGTLWMANGTLYLSSTVQIQAIAADGKGGVQMLADSGDNSGSGDLALYGNALYWTKWDGDLGLYTMPIGGGDAVALAQLKNVGPWALVADDKYVYLSYERVLASGARTNAISRSDVQPGTTTTLLVDPSLKLARFAVDDTDIYVVAGGDEGASNGLVLRMPK